MLGPGTNLYRGRSEIKYWMPVEVSEEVKKYIKPYVDFDPHALKVVDHRYTVRSLYLDSPALNFYYEKVDGVGVRRKLRIRVYNEYHDDAIAFLEIKRKYSSSVIKERAKYPLSDLHNLLFNNDETLPDYSNNGNVVLGKFIYNIRKLDLEPIVLVVYERDAFIGADDERVRLTIDYNVRSAHCTSISQIYTNEDIDPLSHKRCILELKYDTFMPKWMRTLVQEFKISPQAISKYCMCIDNSVMNIK